MARGTVVDWGDAETTWSVYGCRAGLIARVVGRKKIKNWWGSGRDGGGEPADIVTGAWRIATARSITSEGLDVRSSFEGFPRESRARWTINFADDKLELDELAWKYGEHLVDVARYVCDRFAATV